jgi:hypothetical protein
LDPSSILGVSTALFPKINFILGNIFFIKFILNILFNDKIPIK